MDGTQSSEEKQAIDLRGICPYCLSTLEVYLDKKQRPYWTLLALWHQNLRHEEGTRDL